MTPSPTTTVRRCERFFRAAAAARPRSRSRAKGSTTAGGLQCASRPPGCPGRRGLAGLVLQLGPELRLWNLPREACFPRPAVDCSGARRFGRNVSPFTSGRQAYPAEGLRCFSRRQPNRPPDPGRWKGRAVSAAGRLGSVPALRPGPRARRRPTLVPWKPHPCLLSAGFTSCSRIPAASGVTAIDKRPVDGPVQGPQTRPARRYPGEQDPPRRRGPGTLRVLAGRRRLLGRRARPGHCRRASSAKTCGSPASTPPTP